ncbi:MAG: hypothetical protein JXR41_11970 [Bacteroidales bacterium]|nr:hypothetical protein [Bacteroidales bacterium]MBN2763801.1 hypothetical protein [Bacteroidales bacterium]
MKRVFYIALYGILFFSLQHCREEPGETFPDPLVLSASIEDVTEYGGHDGSVDLTVSGGIPPYSFLWTGGKTTEDIDSLSAGTYIITVTDNNKSSQTDTFFVSQPAPETLVLVITGNNVSFYGGADGSASATVTGGVEPYRYKWSNGSSESEIKGLEAGMYYLTVTDAVNSSLTDSIFISQPDQGELIVKYTVVSPSETGLKDGNIDVTISNGYPPYTCSWSNGSNEEDLFDLGAGTYVLTVTDQEDQTVVITVNLSDRLTDIDGNTYAIVKIGEQTWMKENLRVTHNPSGEPVISYTYNDDTNYVPVYGRLYTWDVAMNNSTVEQAQGICPCGWHVPSDEEYKELEMFLGMTREEADMVNTWRGDSVGTKLIVGGSSGYNAQLSGRRSTGGIYSLAGMFEYMWTSTAYDGDFAWRRCLDINSHLCGRWNTFPKSYGFSVRCIKDR